MAQVSWTELIAAGQQGDRLISFPTDTVPALAVRPDRADLIFQTKHRSQSKPLILMAGDIDDLWPFVQGEASARQQWQAVMQQHWPGALTLVLPASDRLPPQINPTDPTTIGVRVPDRAIARHILRQTGPLATTSINRSGEPPLLTLEAINQQFPEVLTLSPDDLNRLERSLDGEVGGAIAAPSSGVPSTVARWTATGWQILRQGAVQL